MPDQGELVTQAAALLDAAISAGVAWLRSKLPPSVIAPAGSQDRPTRDELPEPDRQSETAAPSHVETPEERVLHAIGESPDGLSKSELWRFVRQPAASREPVVDRLLATGKIVVEAIPGRGRSKTVYRLAGQHGQTPVTEEPAEILELADASNVPHWRPTQTIDATKRDGDVVVSVPLRLHERAVLGVIQRDGPLSAATLWRRCKTLPPAWRSETLYDLHRMGYITATQDIGSHNGQTIVASTGKPMPPLDD